MHERNWSKWSEQDVWKKRDVNVLKHNDNVVLIPVKVSMFIFKTTGYWVFILFYK